MSDENIEKKLKEACVILDVRTPDEFAKAHDPRAVNIPLDELEGRLREISSCKESLVVTHCMTGGRARAAQVILERYGFSNVYSILDPLFGLTLVRRYSQPSS